MKEIPQLFTGSERVTASHDVAALSGQTLIIGAAKDNVTHKDPVCEVVYAVSGEKTFAVVTENPKSQNSLGKSVVRS